MGEQDGKLACMFARPESCKIWGRDEHCLPGYLKADFASPFTRSLLHDLDSFDACCSAQFATSIADPSSRSHDERCLPRAPDTKRQACAENSYGQKNRANP